MKIHNVHRWNLDYVEMTALQKQLAQRIRLAPLSLQKIRYVGGCDIAISKRDATAEPSSREAPGLSACAESSGREARGLSGRLVAVATVFSFPDLELVEKRVAMARPLIPYIPGLLSFREIPVLIACWRRVQQVPDVILCDGQGIAHPRGTGLASHLGLLIGVPTVGCAKSRLVGEHGEVGGARGASAPLMYKGARVGTVLRTRDGVKPLYVSPGHLVNHASTRHIVLACATSYRLPEPTRRADQLAAIEKRRYESR